MKKIFLEIDSKVNELFSKTLVTQRFKNENETNLELRIFINKKKDIIFSSFSAKIGDSITVKSKVIKKEKAIEKYNDSIASGNAAIFVAEHPLNKDILIINLGNIPPKQELIFTTEFIHYTESSENYEFELFRNLPILSGKSFNVSDFLIKGKVEINTNNKIKKIEKNILSENLKILEEKCLDDINKNNYFIKYEFNSKEIFQDFNSLQRIKRVELFLESYYIPSSKIYFELEKSEPFIYFQNSLLNDDEKCYNINYRYIEKNIEEENSENISLNPALFIFLIDQSGSMNGDSIEIASKALLLFLQSLPAGSYYQIIGFGSEFKKYDEIPKIYNENNIKKSKEIINKLKADLGGTNIYNPLNDIYNSDKIYEKINLPKIIFLLTDGEIDNKNETLELIEKNSDKFSIYSIGIGNNFDQDLIKNAGIIGKGDYNFCSDIKNLNTVIATEINNSINPYISDFIIDTPLSEKNLYHFNYENIIIKNNKIINFGYILKKNEDINNPINIDIKYIKNSRNIKNEKKKEIKKNYKLNSYEIPNGDELFKLILNNYIIKNSKLTENEKLNLSLKYQILNETTSLFAEIEFSDKITEEMKTIIIGNKENNVIVSQQNRYKGLVGSSCKSSPLTSSISKQSSGFSFGISNIFKSVGDSIKNLFSFKMNQTQSNDIMTTINTQNFVSGFWDVNDKTKKIKNLYEKEFNLLINLKDKNIDNTIAMTIIMIYFINKQHSELLKELIMIIKKAKLYIQEKTKNSYENIIKEIGLN